jgi:hypothetical protein
VRSKTPIVICLFFLIVPGLLRAAELDCGEHDLMFGCTKTEERGRLRAGCGVHEGGRFFASEWRVHDLKTEKVLGKARTGPDGIALIEIPKARWVVLEGAVACSKGARERAIPYRFLVERTGKDSFQQRPYTPENLMATGNWNEDTQLNYGAFRSRFLSGTESAREAAPSP